MSRSLGEARGPTQLGWTLVLPVVALAAAWRLWLMGRYYGWEESDYGNLAMVRGVLDGGFRHFDMNHMPGYYALAAAALAVTGDTTLAARSVTLVGGLTALALSVFLAARLGGRRVAWLVGLLLIFQPEFALYSTSSLREPVYAAFVMGVLASLASERLLLAGMLAGAAFLVRFDGALFLLPVLALHGLGRPPRRWRLLRVLAPLLLTVGLWAAYTRYEFGTAMFWEHAVSVNVDTGLGAEASSGIDWLKRGLTVAATLGAWVLPWRIGWGTWLGLLLGLLLAPWGRHGLVRTWSLAALGMLGVWLGIGLVAQHSPDHNLYWKWLCPIVPVIIPLGVTGVFRLLDRFPRRVATVLLVLVSAQAVASNLTETRRQLTRSATWYRPQVELAQWIESTVPESTPLLVDNIPGCWMNRKPNSRPLYTWFDVPVAATPEDFGSWLLAEKIGYVLWFREEWTQAPVAAPFLAGGGVITVGSLKLTELSREDGYGWIFYQVQPLD